MSIMRLLHSIPIDSEKGEVKFYPQNFLLSLKKSSYILLAAVVMFICQSTASADNLGGNYNLGDRISDLLGYSPQNGSALIWFSYGIGFRSVYDASHNDMSRYSSYHWLAGDFDDDNRTDLIGLSKDRTKYVVFFKKNPNFNQVVEGRLASEGCTYCEFILTDLNSDKRGVHLVAFNRENEEIYTWLSLTNNTFQPPILAYNGPGKLQTYQGHISIGGSTVYNKIRHFYHIYAGDCNGDKINDLYAILPRRERIICYRGLGDGRFLIPQEILNDGHDYGRYEFSVGNLDDRLGSDVIAVDKSTGRVVTWRSAGFKLNRGIELIPSQTNINEYELQFMDVTADGYDDLVGVLPRQTRVLLWENNHGGFNYAKEMHNEGIDRRGYRFASPKIAPPDRINETSYYHDILKKIAQKNFDCKFKITDPLKNPCKLNYTIKF